jgi:membrane-bound lytic murein transglycosylase D
MKKKSNKWEKVVMVSGGFDPIHIGHVRYLQEAKKLGDKLIVGKEEVISTSAKSAIASNNKDNKAKEILYQVKKGDTLLKITQKFPGVTIADIKKWNNIKGESLKPGMKLKING